MLPDSPQAGSDRCRNDIRPLKASVSLPNYQAVHCRNLKGLECSSSTHPRGAQAGPASKVWVSCGTTGFFVGCSPLPATLMSSHLTFLYQYETFIHFGTLQLHSDGSGSKIPKNLLYIAYKMTE